MYREITGRHRIHGNPANFRISLTINRVTDWGPPKGRPPLPIVAAVTPGDAFDPLQQVMRKRFRCSRSSSFGRQREANAHDLFGLESRSTLLSAMKLRMVKLALTSNTADSATSTITSAARVLPPAEVVDPPFISSTPQPDSSSRRLKRGRQPKIKFQSLRKRPEPKEQHQAIHFNTRFVGHKVAGIKVTIKRVIPWANISPSNPPNNDSITPFPSAIASQAARA